MSLNNYRLKNRVKHFGLENGFPSNILISAYNLNDKLVFTSENGIFDYDPDLMKFKPNITFDKKSLKNIRYNFNGSVKDAEIKLPNQLKIENVKFDFLVDQNVINLNEIELSFDKFSIVSEKIRIKKS